MAIGEIIRLLDTHVFDSVFGAYAGIAQIDENLHCIAYRGPDDDGWARSVNITPAGLISEPASNTLEFDATTADYAKVCVRPPNILCIFYRAEDLDRYCEAVIVNSDGTLSQHANNTVRFAEHNYPFGPPIHRHGNIVAIAYSHSNGTSHVCTIAVSDQGEVTSPVVADHEIQAIAQGYPSIAQVEGNTHVVMYQDGANHGYANSVIITEAGAISASGQTQVNITNQYNWSNQLIRLKQNTFLCVHHGPDTKGVAAVFQCSDAGVITVPTNNLYEFDVTSCDTPWALRITDEVFAVAYTGSGTDGFLKTINCAVASAATWTPISAVEFDPNHCEDVVIIKRGPGVYTLCYYGPGDDGILKTYEILDPQSAHGHTEMIMGIGP